MSTPEEHDGQLATLLRDSTAGLDPDVAELVAGGIERGRTTRRRRNLGTALGTIAMGVVVVALAVAPGLGDSSSPEKGTVADQPNDNAKPNQPKAKNGPTPDAALAVAAEDVPAMFEELLPSGDAGPVLTVHPYPVVNEPDQRIAHFPFDGTLTTFIIEPATGMGTCQEQATPPATCARVDGQDVLTSPPTEGDQVTAQSISVWVHGYIVTAMSYNAAEGKEVAPLTDAPPISLEQLTEIATSDRWFSWEPAQ